MPDDTKAGGSGIRQRSRAAGNGGVEDRPRDPRRASLENDPARKAWVERLQAERKLDHLLELEVLLRGLGCFANPRNHPGTAPKGPLAAQDFREHASLVREALGRVVHLSRVLLAEREPAFVFQRYVESVTPDDAARARLADDEGAEDGPERSLLVLRQGMTHVLDVATGLARLPRVPFRAFDATLALAQREIARSAHFRPSGPFEFRPEFDRIDNGPMLELMQAVAKEPTRPIVALTVLSLFRMLRYLTLVEATAAEATAAPKRPAAIVYLVLGVVRSDARALSGYLRRRAGPAIATAFEGEVLAVAAPEMDRDYARLLARSAELREVRSTLENLAANLRLEVRRAFERELPALGDGVPLEELLAAAAKAAKDLRPVFQNMVLLLARSLDARLAAGGVFDDDAARRVSSERLRRDVWLFAQVVQAFAGRSRSVAANGGEDWNAESSPLGFVREFIAYFEAMAYALLRPTDALSVDAFLRTIAELHHADLVHPERVEALAGEADRFVDFLNGLFRAIGRRDELDGSEFDDAAATESLRLYLSA